MFSYLSHFNAIFCKNSLTRYRHPFQSFLIFVIPVCAAVILSYVVHVYPQRFLYPHEKIGAYVAPRVYPAFDFTFDKTIRRFRYPERICYFPATKMTEKFVEQMQLIFASHNSHVQLQFFPKKNKNQVDLFLKNESRTSELPFGCILFKDVSGLAGKSGKFRYGLKSSLQEISVWRENLDPSYEERSPFEENMYILKYLVNQAYIHMKVDYVRRWPVPTSDLIMKRLPYPPHKNSATLWNYLHLALLTCCGYLAAFDVLCHRTVKEKMNGSRERLKLCGLGDMSYWVSNFIFDLLHFSIISSIFVFTYKFSFFNGPVAMEKSDGFLIFLLLTLHSMQLILLGMITSVIFDSSTISSTFTIMATIAGIFSEKILLRLFTNTFAYLFPSVGLTMGLKAIEKFEGSNEGLTWFTITEHPQGYRDATFLHVILMMSLSCVFYFELLWYLDKVWPWQVGPRKPFYFMLTKNYWRPSRTTSTKCQTEHEEALFLEEERPGRPVAIECTELTKQYRKFICVWEKPVVNHVDLKIYTQEITCLLGPNGSGKSSLLNLITGLVEPTSGSVLVNGFDLYQSTNLARNSMALCPQNNPLYDELTVRQHLLLYARIKNFPLDQMPEEVDNILHLVDLTSHSSKVPHQLSGGMKRKLCLAIALVGGSEILILDEPSSGLDADARRVMWDILKKVRKCRTVLITTHDMEEADVLGDRIIIIHSGRIVCSGSSFSLKNAFGTGHVLTMCKSDFQSDATDCIIKKYFPHATIKSNLENQISYVLKDDDARRLLLVDFFNELESKHEELGIYSFGVSSSSLNDVFLKVNQLSLRKYAPHGRRKKSQKDVPFEFIKQLSKPPSFWAQFKCLFIKRFHHAKRSWKTVLLHIFFPCLLLLLQLVTQMLPRFNSVRYSLDLYPKTDVFIRTDGSLFADSFKDHFRRAVGATGHKLIELSNETNINSYFINRMGNRTPREYMDGHLICLEVTSNVSHRKFTGWTNPDAFQAMPILMDLITSTVVSEISNVTQMIHSNGQKDTYVVSIPLSFLTVVIIPLCLSIMPALFTLFPIEERKSNAKLTQIMTGLHPMTFHFASFVFDFILHFFSSITLIVFVYILDTGLKLGTNLLNPLAIFILLLLFGAASIPFSYIWSFLFTDSSRGYNYMFQVTSVPGVLFASANFIFEILKEYKLVLSPSIFELLEASKILPLVAASLGLRKLYHNVQLQEFCAEFDKINCPLITEEMKDPSGIKLISCCPSCYDNVTESDHCVYSNPFGWSGNRIIKEILFMLLSLILFWSILFALESLEPLVSFITKKFFSREKPASTYIDPDVKKERAIIESLIKRERTEEEALVVFDLCKYFTNVFAVRGISFRVHKGECFGLIGVDGSGKSVTFRILTGDLVPSSGKILKGKVDQSVDKSTFLNKLGYCPQFDPLIENVTSREMLYLYCRLRGVPDDFVVDLTEKIIDLVELGEFASVVTNKLSKGNRRRLSLALSIIGDLELILLDQATTGIDPVARGKIWSGLNHILANLECSMLLTSHSMIEYEALCSRLAIMSHGELVCLGTSQHLRFRFGEGYTVKMKIREENISCDEYATELKKRVEETFPSSRIIEHHESMFTYQLPPDVACLSHLFASMEFLKKKLSLEDYSIDDTTLEQILLRFARKIK